MAQLARPGYQHGSRQPGLETSTSAAKQEAQQQEIRDLQQTMAERGGGDAQAYVSEHKLNRAIADRKKLIDSLFIPKGSPGTGGMREFPPHMIDKWMKERYGPYEAWGQDLQYPYEDEDDIPEDILELLKKLQAVWLN